jgi:hypothetical protein
MTKRDEIIFLIIPKWNTFTLLESLEERKLLPSLGRKLELETLLQQRAKLTAESESRRITAYFKFYLNINFPL